MQLIYGREDAIDGNGRFAVISAARFDAAFPITSCPEIPEASGTIQNQHRDALMFSPTKVLGAG